MTENTKKSKGGQLPYFLMIVWPFLSLIIAINNYKKPWAKNIVWLFSGFFGFALVIAGERVDAYRYREFFIDLSKANYSIDKFLGFMYSQSSGFVDVVQPLVTFIISRFTSDPRFMFAAFGFIFGYFFSRNIWYILEHSGKKIKRYYVILIFLFASIIGIWEINIFRFGAAAQVFVFGAMPYLIEGKKKYIGYAALSVFFHFSFFIPVIILIFYAIVGNRYHFYFVLFFVSMFISEINFQEVRTVSEYGPEVFREKASEYINEDYADFRKEKTEAQNWYAKLYVKFLSWSLWLMLITVYANISKLKRYNSWLLSLFSFTLLLYGVFNILGNLPVVVRFIGLANMFVVAFVFMFFQHDYGVTRNRILMWIAMPSIILFLAMKTRIASDFSGINTVIGNPVSAIVIEETIPLIEVIKGN